MAETQSKRHREESHKEVVEEETFEPQDSNSKRQKSSYNNILSILDEEQEENQPNQDLSAIFSTLQQELSTTSPSSATATTFDSDPLPHTALEADQNHQQAAATAATSGSPEEEEDDSVRVIRHLLEASDDELGIPNTNRFEEEIDSGNYNAFASFDGFWELEDEAANYYNVLQSELFM